MLDFYQNGKKIELSAIYSGGKVGQMVIYGESVDWGEKPDTIANPLSMYSVPSIFTIVEKEGQYEYILVDSEGNRIKVKIGSGVEYLYDAQKWLDFDAKRKKEYASVKQQKIEKLKDHEKLLKEILTQQGIRIVSQAKAKELGID